MLAFMGHHDDDAAAASGLSGFIAHPAAQGTITGLLTLIPARNYPQWLRRGIVWGPTVILSAGMATMGANPQMTQKLSEQLAGAEQPGQLTRTEQSQSGEQPAPAQNVTPGDPPGDATQDRSEHATQDQPATQPEPAGGLRSAVLGMFTGAVLGLALSASVAAAFWADEKIDRGLSRLRVPFPRAVMGVAAGTATWWSVTKENQREPARGSAAPQTG